MRTSHRFIHAGRAQWSLAWLLVAATLLALVASEQRASPALGQDYPLPVQPFAMLAPFPVVRIVGSASTRVTRFSVVTVKAGTGVAILSTCFPRSRCPYVRRRSTVSGLPGRIRIHHIRGFERRSFQPGVTLSVYIMGAGRIGKYTSFTIREGKQPRRTDRCVRGLEARALRCPTN